MNPDSNQSSCFKTALIGEANSAHKVDFVRPAGKTNDRGVIMRISNFSPLSQAYVRTQGPVLLSIKIESGCYINSLFGNGRITYSLFNPSHK